jgi:hypothetical protein
MIRVKWTHLILIGLTSSWLFTPMVRDYGAINPEGHFLPMVSSHFIWNKTFGGIHYEEGTSVVETDDGGFAIAGRTGSFGAIEGVDEVWLVRCDQNGTHLWNHTYGGGFVHGGHMSSFHKSVRLENTSDGGFLITSHTAHNSVGDADGWLVRTDTDGNPLWNYTYGGPDDEYFVESVACSDGGFISGGFTENKTIGNVDGWLIRTDADGNHLWNYTYGSPIFGEVGYDVIEVSGGGFLMTGWAGDFDYVDDPNRFAVNSSCWIVRVDADGNHLWNQTYGTEHQGTYAVECQDGGFAIIGGMGNASEHILDVILVRIDANGQHLWNQTYGDTDIEAALEFAECSDGGFAIFALNYRSYAVSDGWFIRTAENGTALWNQTYGGSYFDQFWAGIIASNGDFVCVGKTHSFGAGSSDMWVVRIPDEAPSDAPPPPPPLWLYGVIAAVIVISISFVLLLFHKRSRD